jgi:hypothetical protein
MIKEEYIEMRLEELIWEAESWTTIHPALTAKRLLDSYIGGELTMREALLIGLNDDIHRSKRG